MTHTSRVDGSCLGRQLGWRRISQIGFVLALSLLVMSGCSLLPASGGPKDSATILMSGGTAGVTSTDPTVSSLRFTVQWHVFDAIVGYNGHTMQYDTSGLAESWKLLDDRTWQFKLKPGITFHNGDPLTAADVKFTIERILDPETKNTQCGQYSFITSVAVVDDLTFNVITEFPSGQMLGVMTVVCPVPAKAYQQMGPDAFAKTPIGTGAYKLSQYALDEFYELEAFDQYWGPKPTLKKLTFKYVTEPGTKVAALRAGEADLVDLVPPTEIDTLKQDPSLTVSTSGSMRAMFIGMNSTKKPFDDRRVRQAMNYAVDWDDIIKNVAFGDKRLATMVSSGTEGFDASMKPYPHDPAKARQLLTEAG